ncbi:MAG: serine hydrolase, partial [Lachnospiraceae bacterium]|nr:serine hydrolase [Lachnospiraceae bacterium]
MKPSKLSYFMILLLILSLALQPVNTTYLAKAATSTSLEASENAVVTLHSKNKRPSVYADSAILMDANTGAVLYSKRIHKKQYPASITKIMTTLLALENLSPTDTVTFSRNAVYSIEPGSSSIGIDEGEELTVEQCLYGIMLASANEVSNAIAEQVAGDNASFANMMNEKSTELGCVNTHFTNPHGLHDKEHYTTAYDMALIAKEAYQNEEYKK